MSKLHLTFATVLSLLAAPHVAVAQSSASYSLPTKRMLSPHNLERVWWNQATLDPSRDVIRHLTADENVVVVQSRSGLTTAFDISNGRKLWAVQVNRLDSVAFPAITNDDYVMIASGSALFALQKFTGKLAWKFQLPSSPSTSPAIDDDQIYVGSRDGSVYAFDLRKITKLSNERLLPKWSNLTQVWRYKAFKEVTTPPVSTGRVVNFATRGKSLYSVTATDRKLVFQFETDHAISAPMAQSQGFLYLPSEDFKLYCINEENGRTRWVYNTGRPIRMQPKVIGQDVFLTPAHGGLHSVALKSTKTTELVLSGTLKKDDLIEVSINGTKISYLMLGTETNLADISIALAKSINAENIADTTADASAMNGTITISSHSDTDIASGVTNNNIAVDGKIGQRTKKNVRAGNRKWWRPKITKFVSASPSRVYASDNLGNLIVLNRGDGAMIAALPLRRFSVRLSNGRTDRIIIAKPSGLVACIREKGQEFPIYHMHPDRNPLLPEFATDPPAPQVPSKKLNP